MILSKQKNNVVQISVSKHNISFKAAITMICDLSLHCLKVQHWVNFSLTFTLVSVPVSLPPYPSTTSFKHTTATTRTRMSKTCIFNDERVLNALHTLHVQFSFFSYISQPFSCSPRREMTCFAIMWTTWALDEKFSIFSLYFQSTLDPIWKAKQLVTARNYCKKGTFLDDVQAVAIEPLG